MIHGVLMHQGIGLDAFNRMPTRRAIHALYECCNSVTMAADLATGRPYPDRAALFREADSLLFALSEASVDDILQAYPKLGSRPGSARSHAEHCALWDERPGVMHLLDSSARGYADKFGFEFVMCVTEDCPASAVVAFGFLPIPYPAMGRWQPPPDEDDDESDDAWDDDSPSGDDSDDGDEPTVPCPYCGHEILEDAPRCPACERYLSLEDSPAPRKPLWVIVTALVCLAAVIWWIVAA